MSMTDDAALTRPFLDTIRAAMKADSADASQWLVYADWLDERGECGLAELIRVACELEAMGPGRPVIKCESVEIDEPVNDWIVVRATTHGSDFFLKPENNVVKLVCAYDTDAVIGMPTFNRQTRLYDIVGRIIPPDPLAAKRDAASRRVGELEQAVAKAMPDLGGSPPALTWRRGLVIELSSEWQAWLAHGDAIVGRHPVVAVQFNAGMPAQLSGATIAAELKDRWPDVGFSWRWRFPVQAVQRTHSRDIIGELTEQPIHPGDELDWMPMRGGEGGPAGG